MRRFLAALLVGGDAEGHREQHGGKLFAPAEIADGFRPLALESELHVAVLGALAGEAVIVLKHGFDDIHEFVAGFDFFVQIQIHGAPLGLRDAPSKRPQRTDRPTGLATRRRLALVRASWARIVTPLQGMERMVNAQ